MWLHVWSSKIISTKVPMLTKCLPRARLCSITLTCFIPFQWGSYFSYSRFTMRNKITERLSNLSKIPQEVTEPGFQTRQSAPLTVPLTPILCCLPRVQKCYYGYCYKGRSGDIYVTALIGLHLYHSRRHISLSTEKLHLNPPYSIIWSPKRQP
jgi:hypothetical protein